MLCEISDKGYIFCFLCRYHQSEEQQLQEHPIQHSDVDEESEKDCNSDSEAKPAPSKKIGTKKLKKLQLKEEKKKLREEEAKRREEQKKEDEKKEQARKLEEETLQKEEERMVRNSLNEF